MAVNPHGCWEWSLGPLEGQQRLLVTQPSSQALTLISIGHFSLYPLHNQEGQALFPG